MTNDGMAETAPPHTLGLDQAAFAKQARAWAAACDGRATAPSAGVPWQWIWTWHSDGAGGYLATQVVHHRRPVGEAPSRIPSADSNALSRAPDDLTRTVAAAKSEEGLPPCSSGTADLVHATDDTASTDDLSPQPWLLEIHVVYSATFGVPSLYFRAATIGETAGREQAKLLKPQGGAHRRR